MKICFVSPFCHVYFSGHGGGGAELQVIELAKMFAQRGHDVTIITSPFDSAVDCVSMPNGVIVKQTPFRFYGGSNYFFCLILYDWFGCFGEKMRISIS